nr:innexin inx1-like [Danaus plexippus plexippus]
MWVYHLPRTVPVCRYHTALSASSLQTHDSLCILPLNIVNEKTYIFLWFWYIILAVILVLLVIYRLIIIFVPSVRPRLLHARSRTIAMESALIISQRTDVGDWWLLYMLARNMDPLIYRELISELIKRMGEKTGPRA